MNKKIISICLFIAMLSVFPSITQGEINMRTITYAFQYPDYNQENFGETSLENAIKVFKTFAWDQYIRTYKEKEDAGQEAAPPNICFTDGKNNFMIWANTKHKYGIMASVPIKRLLMNSQKTLEYAPVSEANVNVLLKAYFEGDFETIKNYK
jgi:hypothetical protein